MNKAKCYDCGLKYGSDQWIEAVIPDKIWNMIKPEGCADGCGLLCISCIAKRIRKLKVKNKIPVWLCGTEPLEAMSGDPSENIEILRSFKLR